MFVLGVSHVSRESVDAVRELIQAVRPEVVLLELCKDRLRLLLDPVRAPFRSLCRFSVGRCARPRLWPSGRFSPALCYAYNDCPHSKSCCAIQAYICLHELGCT